LYDVHVCDPPSKEGPPGEGRRGRDFNEVSSSFLRSAPSPGA
jgi:hypothetical protein